MTSDIRQGLSELFQDDRYLSRPVSKFHPTTIPGIIVSLGSSKLCHKTLLVSCPFFTTKFPKSERWAIGLFPALLDMLDDDQMVLFVALRSTRIPFSLSLRTPDILSRGVFRLATHTTVRGDIFLYHIPKYRLVEFPGLKKPSSVIPPAETKVSLSPSRIDSLTAKLSIEVEALAM
ncbi:hypothetical protein CR513_21790, partial [Mucuna pruriens]